MLLSVRSIKKVAICINPLLKTKTIIATFGNFFHFYLKHLILVQNKGDISVVLSRAGEYYRLASSVSDKL